MRLLILASVILTIFAIVATAAHDGLCLGATWDTWISAALLAFFVDLLLGDRAYFGTPVWGTRRTTNVP